MLSQKRANHLLDLDVAHEYSEWLKVRLRTVRRGEATVLTTPFLDPFNDGIRVFVEPHGGELLLHDNGDTLDEEGAENARKISEQTMSILEGYSDTVYRWGGRSEPGFARLFAVA